MNFRVTFCIIVTILTWSTAFVGNKIALADYDPFTLPLIRYIFGSLTLGILAFFQPFRLPDKQDLPAIFACGLFGISLYNFCLYSGQQTIPVGVASLLTNSAPIFTAFISVIWLKEKFTLWGWTGIFTSFAGVVLIVLGKPGPLTIELGALWALASAVSISFYFIMQKPLFNKYTSFEVVTYSIWSGTIILAPALPWMIEDLLQADPSITLTAAYLGIFPGAFGYFTWSIVLANMPASKASPFIYLIPVLAFILSYFILDEVPTQLTIIGGIITISGVFIVNKLGK
jgi:drug/metabolite transporter (DMT)-like permease